MDTPDTPVASFSALRKLFDPEAFRARHIGLSLQDEAFMLQKLGFASRQAFITAVVPDAVRNERLLLPDPVNENEALSALRELSEGNLLWRSYIGGGYYGTFTPEPIRRNVLENPGWYTAYTPYQAEIAQGRLEALFHFQQMISGLTGLPVANASLLDEASAVAEAMAMARRVSGAASPRFFMDAASHPQILSVVATRARWMDVSIVVDDAAVLLSGDGDYFGAYLPTPDTHGRLRDFSEHICALQRDGVKVVVGCDPLALVLTKSPGAMGADMAVGSAQRFGVPLGYGGPHAAFLATKSAFLRAMPGRIIGMSVDASGRAAFRMALQTREQHIRRDKATSNICTAQALLASMAAFFAIYHGVTGLRRIAQRVNGLTNLLAFVVANVGRQTAPLTSNVPAEGPLRPMSDGWFDTLSYQLSQQPFLAVRARAKALKINLRGLDSVETIDCVERAKIGVSLDETTGLADIVDLIYVLTGSVVGEAALEQHFARAVEGIPSTLKREDGVLTHPIFQQSPSETTFVRYLKQLENKDFSLVHAMIPLGSCTMKLNAATEMVPVTWPAFADMHPFVPAEQAKGYAAVLSQLGEWLAQMTGFSAVSFQPNSGAQGEYAGLLAIREYLASKGEGARNVCLIPASAHGTNPASAHMVGMQIVEVACDARGDVDVADLEVKIERYRASLAALMVTFPSTHGVFESSIREICQKVHAGGGQVYLDGANLNAQVGLMQPADWGADVCHVNLHKTFCIPHGGGGTGMGPIAVAPHLMPYLPQPPFPVVGQRSVSGAHYGSALIATIPWLYIRMMGASGLRHATQVAILSANYVAARLKPYFPVRYYGESGYVAHECVIDLQSSRYGVRAQDVAKRLMDYGFHAPTVSFPVPDSLMIEPTESESLEELDRFCDAMIAIHGELERVRRGEWPMDNNPLTQAPHTAQELAGDWAHPYSRELAVYPLPYLRQRKHWPAVKRVDEAAGDRSLVQSLRG